VNTALLAGSAIASQFINFGGTLVNARLYGPSEFGLFGLFSGVLGVALFAASWRYELAIVTTDDEDKAQDTALFVCVAGVSSATVFVLALLIIESIPGGLGLSAAFRRTVAVTPLVLVLTSLILAGTNLCVRRRQFVRVALQQIVMALVTVCSQALLVGVSTPGGGLVAGFVLGQCAAAATLAPPVLRVLSDRIRVPAPWRRLQATAREHHRYFFYVIPYSLLTQIYVQGPIFLLGFLFNIADVGFFSLAYRTTTAPLGLLPAALAQVLFPELARDHERLGKWGPSIQALFGTLGILYAPAVAVIVAFGPDVFAMALGEQWRHAGAFAQIMIVPNMLIMLCTGYDRIYFILNRQKTALLLTIVSCVPSAAFMWSGYFLGGQPKWLIVGWSAAQIVTFLMWIGVVSYLSGFSLRALCGRVALVIGNIAVLTLVLGGSWEVRETPALASGFLLVTGTIYVAMLWWDIRQLKGLLQKSA